jgi:hypothetical protein
MKPIYCVHPAGCSEKARHGDGLCEAHHTAKIWGHDKRPTHAAPTTVASKPTLH